MADEKKAKRRISDLTLTLIVFIIGLSIMAATEHIKYTNLINKCVKYEKVLAQNEQTLNQIENDYNKNITNSIIRLNTKLDPVLVTQLQKSIKTYAKEYNLPPELIISVIYRESTFKPTAVSKAKCLGLTQINPKAHPEKIKAMGIKYNEIFYIDNNVHLGCWVLREYIDKYKSVDKALKKYVGGNLNGYVSDILKTYSNLMVKI